VASQLLSNVFQIIRINRQYTESRQILGSGEVRTAPDQSQSMRISAAERILGFQ